jgi:DNA-binding response OmpR family regulator
MPIKILIIDDEKRFCSALTRLLKREGEVNSAHTLGHGLEVARFWHPDLVLLDVNFKGSATRGVDILPDLLAISPRPHVIVNTSMPDDVDEYSAHASGAITYLRKDVLKYSPEGKQLGYMDIVRLIIKHRVSFPDSGELAANFGPARGAR